MNREVYGKSYERGFRLTVRFLISRGVGMDSAEDAAQLAWTKGWEHLGQLRDDRMVITWVNSIAWNVVRSLARRLPFEELPEVAVLPNVNLAALDVARALRSCKTAESLLLRQHYLEGHRIKDIARQEGRTPTAVRIRLLRARRSARAQLARTAA
jgi:DNA-directed RNA polymerase specialized sigma24 family protein